METIDRLVRLLDDANTRIAGLEGTIQALREAALAEKPYSPAYADPDALARELALAGRGGKMAAIKLHRHFARTTLKEAKDAVERYWIAGNGDLAEVKNFDPKVE